jgi:hypothetical protein
MGKIFEFRPGSYIDQVSGAVGVYNSNTGFSRTEKGVALTTVWPGGNQPLVFSDLSDWSGDITVEFSFKMQIEDNAGVSFMYQKGDLACDLQNERLNMLTVGGSFNDSQLYEFNKWYHIIFTITSGGETASLYRNGTLVATQDLSSSPRDFSGDLYLMDRTLLSRDWIGSMGRFTVYDHILTEKERAKLFSEFLRATPTSKIIE